MDVVVRELKKKVLAASNAALRRWAKSSTSAEPAVSSIAASRRVERSSSAAQPAASSGAAQPAHDDAESRKCTSLREVGAWLETLPDVVENAELRKIREAVQVLEKPTKKSVFAICSAWKQEKKRKQKDLTLDVIVQELKEKVLAACH